LQNINQHKQKTNIIQIYGIMTRIIKLYNRFHLGDQIFNFILFYNIKEYIESHKIKIHYYCEKQYHYQLSEFKCSKNIEIFEYSPHLNMTDALHVWVGDQIFNTCWYNKCDEFQGKQNIYYVAFFNEVLQTLRIPQTFKTLEYEDPDLLARYTNINKKCNSKYTELDFLIINSTARSGQYYRDDAEWNPLILKLNEKYKIVTTEKVKGVHCTQDDNLTVKDIAAISTKAKKIIAVNSGVVPGLFNTYTLNNVDIIYTFSYADCHEHPKIVSMTNINDLNVLLV